jgi:hypothetical protein
MRDLLGALRRAARRGCLPPPDEQLGLALEGGEPAPGPGHPSPRDAGLPFARDGATAPADAAGHRRARGRAARRAQAATLLQRLRLLGLRGIDTVTLMHTRRTMVSVAGTTLRVHDGYALAPEPVLRAIVTFATARTRAARAAARAVILAHPVDRPPPSRRAEPLRPGDAPLLARLAEAHAELNVRHFGGALSRIPVLLSARMKTRLGHYAPRGDAAPHGLIVLGRRHLRRDGWAEALHTLLHEMVHQWQDESGLPLDHGTAFRRKAREVGVLPRAKRPVG